MPRYYFDIRDGLTYRDTNGADLASLECARSHAMTVATAYANDPKMLGSGGGAIVIEVRDETALLLSIRLVFNVQPH